MAKLLSEKIAGEIRVHCLDCRYPVGYWNGSAWQRDTDYGPVEFTFSTFCPNGHSVDLPNDEEVKAFSAERADKFVWDVSDIQWSNAS